MNPYYEQDGITIYHGDCREVLPLLPVNSVDLVLTDPPYASGARGDANKGMRGSMTRSVDDADWFSHDSMTTWGFNWFLRSVLAPLHRTTAEGSHLYWFTDWRMTPVLYGMLEAHGYRVNHCLVWDKRHFGMGSYWRNQYEHIIFASLGQPLPMLDRGRGTVLSFPTVSAANRDHPTEKPVELLRSIIGAVPGGTVLDPFMGCGSTLRAAKDLGRKAIGIEIEERYCEIAANRLAQGVLALTTDPHDQSGVLPELIGFQT